MPSPHVQENDFILTTGALGYRSRSDITATRAGYLVPGSQNVLVNEATNDQGDKVETRNGYEVFGSENTDRDKIVSAFTWRDKAGNEIMMRFVADNDLEYYSEQSSDWETLLTGLDGNNPMRFTTVWNGTEQVREVLFVNHSDTLYSWSGAFATLDSTTSNSITINENIGTSGFLTSSTIETIRVKDSGGTWREFTVDSHDGTDTFTVSGDDPTNYTFDTNALVVEATRSNADTPADGFINDVIGILDNAVFIGSDTSSVVYMSHDDDYTNYSFSSPRLPGEGWQFVLDDFTVGFETSITREGEEESMIIFAGNDWIYRISFELKGDSSIKELAKIHPFVVSNGQGAQTQELIEKVGNSIVYLNNFEELVELGSVVDLAMVQQVPLSDPIRPDFVDADFTDGQLRFHRNNLYITAPGTDPVERMFILAFRMDNGQNISFWQPPQILPAAQLSSYKGDLIGHSHSIEESYKLFSGTNDNDKPITFRAHFAYTNHASGDADDNRLKLKRFDKYFSELYIAGNTEITHKIVYEYLGAEGMQTFTYSGDEDEFLFTPDPGASLGVNTLGTSPLGGSITQAEEFRKYRRFKTVQPVDHFEYQVRYESDALDDRWQVLVHGPNVTLSSNAPTDKVR